MKTILLVLLLATAIYAAEKISLSGHFHQFLKKKFHKKPEVTPVVENSGFSDDVQAGWTKTKEGAQKLTATAIEDAKKAGTYVSDKFNQAHEWLKNKFTSKKPEVKPVVETSGFSDDVQVGWNKAKEGAQKLSTSAIENAKKVGTIVSDKFQQFRDYLKSKFTSNKPEATTETSGFGFADFIKSPHHHHKWNQTLNHTKNATKSFFHHHAQKALDWVKGIFGHHNKSKSNHTFNHSHWNHSHHHHNHTRLVEESGVLVQAKNFLAAQGKKIYDKIKSFGKKPEVAPPAPEPEPEASGVVTDNLVKIKDSAKEIASTIKDKIKTVIGKIKNHFRPEVVAPAADTSGMGGEAYRNFVSHRGKW